MASFDLTVKVILLGDYDVKKGTIMRALTALPAEPEVSCLSARHGVVEMLFVRDQKRVRVKIHDTAGQERFRSITTSYYRGTHGCLLLFDVTQKSTFENLHEWEQELRDRSLHEDIEVTLAGCSCDVASSERQVARRTANEFANYLGVPYEEVSVRIVTTLLQALESLVDRIILKASRSPSRSIAITPLETKMLQIQEQEKRAGRATCSC